MLEIEVGDTVTENPWRPTSITLYPGWLAIPSTRVGVVQGTRMRYGSPEYRVRWEGGGEEWATAHEVKKSVRAYLQTIQIITFQTLA